MLPFEDALERLLAAASPLGRTEEVGLLEADGRILAQDLVSALQVPPFDNSAMDGYAVRVAEAGAGAVLPVSQRIAAGAVGGPLVPGSVARIFTGAPVPQGADAVVPQEDTETLEGARVRLLRAPQAGQAIRRSGEDIARGSVVLAAGERLTPASLGLAASIGLDRVPVAGRVRVALLSTGDELVMPGAVAPQNLPPGAIYNSNRYFLHRMLERLGCAVTEVGSVADTREATLQALQDAAATHDVIVTTGGVSVGEEDHVRAAVQALGTLDLWQVAIKPGKPFALGRIGSARVIGLPGNPVSSFVTFVVLVRPFLLRLQGARHLQPTPLQMPAGFDWPRPDPRREFLRAQSQPDGSVALFPNQGSGVLTSLAWADGLVDNPPGQPIAKGDPVRFLRLGDLL
jgi:molybdopterin molybdotransferase